MTQEEYEAKVQSMPKELQNQFRKNLEINLSKRIVNRFMGVVMQAYAWGQRDAQTGEGSQNAAYMHGAQDMKEAIQVSLCMDSQEANNYFGISPSSLRIVKLLELNEKIILNGVEMYKVDKENDKKRMEENDVRGMADSIGIDRLLEIANSIKQEDELPC